MDGMVTIMQTALQIYAGTVISRARVRLQANVGAAVSGEDQAAADALVAAAKEGDSNAASDLLEKLLHIHTDDWEMEIKKGTESGVKKEKAFAQKTIIPTINIFFTSVIFIY